MTMDYHMINQEVALFTVVPCVISFLQQISIALSMQYEIIYSVYLPVHFHPYQSHIYLRNIKVHLQSSPGLNRLSICWHNIAQRDLVMFMTSCKLDPINKS